MYGLSAIPVAAGDSVVRIRSAAALAMLACLSTTTAGAAWAAASPVGASTDYRLDAGDKLRLTVFGEPALTGEYVVGSNGRMALPLIGEVGAKGATTTEVEAMIETKLKDGYLRDPRVSLEVMTHRPFYILGEVNKPGEYPYTADLTVVRAVATANGFTYRANKKQVFIRHAGEASEKAYPAESSQPLAPGDTVRVAERFF
jgi:polysaccharide export outer membrane protein